MGEIEELRAKAIASMASASIQKNKSSPKSKEEGELSSSEDADNSENPSTPGSPTSAGFSTDRLPPNTSRTSESYSDEDEATVDLEIIGVLIALCRVKRGRGNRWGLDSTPASPPPPVSLKKSLEIDGNVELDTARYG